LDGKKQKKADNFPFVAYCCGKPMLKERQDDYVYFRCANPDHGRWFAVSIDPSKQSYCSCDWGRSPLMTKDFGNFRLYGGCEVCGARYSIYKEGVQIAFEVQGSKPNEVNEVSAKGLASIWDHLGGISPNIDVDFTIAKSDLTEMIKRICPNIDIRVREILDSARYVSPLGYETKDSHITLHAAEDDFFSFFEQCLKTPKAKVAEEGRYDPAIVGLAEKINGMNKNFVLVDYGCGQGRLIDGLVYIDKKVLALMTYIGVDKDPKCLEASNDAITKSSLKELANSVSLMLQEEFFHTNVKTDYIFAINVLHEIPLIELPTVLHKIESKLRIGGHFVVHEMRELVEGERGFVTWDENDFTTAFKGTSLVPHCHSYETKRDHVPLISVDLIKEEERQVRLVDYVDNCMEMYHSKKHRIGEQLKEIEQNSTATYKSKRFAFLNVLYNNVDRQVRDYEENEKAQRAQKGSNDYRHKRHR
jgi:hypothetical protein